MKRCALLLLLLFVATLLRGPVAAAQEEDLRVLNAPGGPWMQYTDAPNALYRHLTEEVGRLMEARSARLEGLRGSDDWRRYIADVRQSLTDRLGPFPERTPLNARITGTLERDGYTVEKVLYESRPGVPVTGALFLPAQRSGPAPAVLYLSGHSTLAFRSAAYQQVILNLVRQGFVVLAIDPVGQGERLEYGYPELGIVDPTLANTRGHSYVGAQLFLTGVSLAGVMTWDGVRALDYLVERPEVDPTRIAVTGRSGGGTQAAYLAAIDERVSAAAIENYITSFDRLWQTRGPQDAEQHLPGGIAAGLDHGDLLLARAPRPTLVIATTRDIFSIQGARETYAAARRGFEALGAGESLRMVEDDAGHASTRANREALYAFLQTALDHPGDAVDLPVDTIPAVELQVTGTGHVLTSLQPETAFERNRARAAELRDARAGRGRSPEERVEAARRLTGYREPGPADPSGAEEVVFMGRHPRPGYAIEKYILPGEGGYPIPFLLLRPEGAETAPVILVLDPDGKGARAGAGGELEWLVRQGFAVVAPDLLGIGEMGPGDFIGDSSDFGERGRAPYGLWFGALSVGRSIVGIHAADVVRLARHLGARDDVDGASPRAVAIGELGPALLHAAAFDPVLGSIALVGSLESYDELVATRDYEPRWTIGGAGGMLTEYDLADLVAAVGESRVTLLEPRSATLPVNWDEDDDDDIDEQHPGEPAGIASALREWLR